MKRVVVAAVAVLALGAAPVPVGQKDRGKELAALEHKLVGAWKGKSGCAGDFLFGADGTYDLKDHGPAPSDTAGTWRVRWDALPPTLLLTCQKSELEQEIGRTTEWKLVKLDDEALAVQHGQTPFRYEREKK